MSNEHLEVSDESERILATIEAARQQGLLLHDMMDPSTFPGVTDWLAERGILTTTTPRDPGPWKAFCRQRGTERELETSRTNGSEALENVEPYRLAQEQGQLTPLLLGVLVAPTAMHLDDIHMVAPVVDTEGNIVEGEAVAFGWTTLTVRTAKERELLRGALQALARTATNNTLHEVRTGSKAEEGAHTVSISNLNEYSVRNVEAAIARIVAESDKAETGTVMPERRLPYSVSVARGETYHPDVIGRIFVVNAAYWGIKLSATFRDGMPEVDLEEARASKTEALVTSPAPFLELMRKAVNGVVHELRGTSEHNQEQHDDPEWDWRLLIEEDVHLKRDPEGSGHVGPPSARAHKASELARQKAGHLVKELKKHPFKAAGKLIAKAFTAGADLLLDIAIEGAPLLSGYGARLKQDRRDWWLQKQRALEAGADIDRVVAQARGQA